MFSACANPDCHVTFDYREGHFFRFHKASAPGERPPNTHSVQHFWLCGKCSAEQTLEYKDGQGVMLLRHPEISAQWEAHRFVAAA